MDPPRDQQTATRDNDDDDNINRLDTITTAEQGFAFLDTFDQLQEWSVADVDPLQKSNIPRIAPPNDAAPRSKVMLIHDYAGGYNAYEASQGGVTREERFACEHLQHVETFVYFSHHLVSVPPPTWTNTCHRSGVRVLGTFIVEPGSRQVERILERDENGSFWVARKLAEMAACYGFDGWLVNIEQPFPLWSWNADRLESFLRQLRRELGGGKQVVWYDALTTLNFVWYQNTVNYLNLSFALAAGSILTNYAWNPDLAKRGRDLAVSSGLGVENVYFGIDMWAQNVQHGPNRRVTWPRETGGGTGTGMGVQALQQLGLSTGLFAPGWSYEHFASSHGSVEKAVWYGEELPESLACECSPERPHHSPSYRDHGIVTAISPHPVGSQSFFHTDFQRAFRYLSPESGYLVHMGAQGILPPWTNADGSSSLGHQPKLVASLLGNPTYCQIRAFVCGNPPTKPSSFKLFNLNISGDRNYVLEASYRTFDTHRVFLTIDRSSDTQERIALPASTDLEVDFITATIPHRSSSHLRAISVEIHWHNPGEPDTRDPILNLHSITISPETHAQSIHDISPIALVPTAHSPGTPRQYRLRWALVSPTSSSPDLPHSPITGPCEHFTICIDGQALGRAYALEAIVPPDVVARWRTEQMATVEIIGVGFNGCRVAHASVAVPWEREREEEWVVL